MTPIPTLPTASLALIAVIAPVQAQDASFGCKVLLCAAAVSPSWRAIPYCVPPMTQLLSLLRRGGAWPSCPEGGSVGGLGYDPYEACPSGLSAYSASTASAGSNGATAAWTADANGGWCGDPAQMSPPPQSCSGDNGCTPSSTYPPAQRPTRSDPYYVDLRPTGGETTRFYFSLNP